MPTRILILAAGLFVAAPFCIAPAQAADPPTTPAKPIKFSDPDIKEMMVILERITRTDEGWQSISVINSQVMIKTPGIEFVVRKGMKAIPLLIEIMKNDELSFDTFARCYSACEQILRSKDKSIIVKWSGGAETKKSHGRTWRILPFGQIDVKSFRKEVRDDIVRLHEKLK
jgi:hypothetical protein